MTQPHLSQVQLPKRGVTELHVHLGGAVPIHRLFEAAIDRGIRLPVDSYEEFANLIQRRKDNSGSLEKYLEIYEVAERIQSGPDALRESALVAINGAARTGAPFIPQDPLLRPDNEQPLRFPIRRLELRFNPMKRNSGGIWDLDRVVLAACSAVQEIRTAYKGKMQVGLIICLGRDLPYEQNRVLAKKVRHWSQMGLPVIGIDLAGSESSNTLSDPEELKKMAELYEIAGPLVGRTIHCGETRAIDLKTFLATLKACKANRVGHPLVAARAYWEDQDDSGLRFMAEHQIVAELCVVSNLLTGSMDKVEDYQRLLDLFDQYEIPYTFSTDAPALQKTSLAGELALLLENRGATVAQIEKALQTADEASFLP